MSKKTDAHGDDSAALLKRVLPALHEARRKIEGLQARTYEPIAVVGMGLRFPGANSPESFWELLKQGVDQIREVPRDRWTVEEFYDPQPGLPGKMYLREAGFIDAVDQFDAAFFGVSRREAESMDPQHRILLEVAWEALERAGIAPGDLEGSRSGVFIGMSENDYAGLENDGENYSVYSTTGNSNYFGVGRLSYFLGLQGASLMVDTACSASLVGVHLAIQSLRQGECDLALAGGVQLMLTPEPMIATAQLNAFAADGRCKTFDAAADGYGRGEGCGVIVLKRLSDAKAAGDQVLAVLRGSAVNHGGRSSGLTSPNRPAQEALLRQALKNARVRPEEISYIEAHGTGTHLGDPIEVGAVASVFAERQEPLWMGAVKTNIGHLEPASGIAGLIKVVLSMQHGVIPPSLHFKDPNPLIDWEGAGIQIPTTCQDWAEQGRIAGVSSFGISGTNCHVVVAEAPAEEVVVAENHPERPWHLLTVSAKERGALTELVARYRQFVTESPDLPPADLCFSANQGRTDFNERVSFVFKDLTQLQDQLSAFPERTSPLVAESVIPEGQLKPRVGFLFTGQGAQTPDMGRELYETQPAFRETLRKCDELLKPMIGGSICSVIYDDDSKAKGTLGEERLNQTINTQPALFVVEYALAKLLGSWGIQPSAVMGHSVGEYVAACLAGVFTLEDGLKLIAARGRLMQGLPSGAMVSFGCSEDQILSAIEPFRGRVSIAAINGPQSVVVSGEIDAIETLIEKFGSLGVPTHRLKVSHAFHSPMMDPILGAFRDVAHSIAFHPPAIPLISNLTGRLAGDEVASADYWVRHLRDTVRFEEGIQSLGDHAANIFLEIGPQPILTGMASRCLPERSDSQGPLILPTLRGPGTDWQSLLSSCGQMYVHGVDLDWRGFEQDYSRRKVSVPVYPFQRLRYWTRLGSGRRSPGGSKSELESERVLRLPTEKKVILETEFSLDRMPALVDHRIMGEVVIPGATFVSMMFDAAKVLFPDGPLEVNDIVFHQPLVLESLDRFTVQTILAGDSGSVGDFRASVDFVHVSIISFPAAGAMNVTPRLHATGTLRRLDRASAGELDLEELRRTCSKPIPHRQWYNRLVETGIVLGPHFGWIEELWKAGDFSLGRLRLPRCFGGDLPGKLIPMALLDTCTIVADDFEDGRSATRLPFAVDSVQWDRAAVGDEWWCYAEKLGEGKYDFQLLDAQGKVLLRAAGFADKEAPAEKLFRQEGGEVSESPFHWRPTRIHSVPCWSQIMRLPADRKLVLETELSLARAPYLSELEIFGQAIVPVSYSVSLLLDAAHSLFPAATYELFDLVFHQPVMINPNEEHVLQGSVDLKSMGDSGKGPLLDLDFELTNYRVDGARRGSPAMYASGTLGIRKSQVPRFKTINDLKARCGERLAFETWYPWISKKQYTVGSFYHEWFAELWRGENETLTRLVRPESAEGGEGHALYFALFHGCIMATNLAFLHEDKIVRTPYSIGSLQLHRPVTGSEWWCYSQRIGESKYNFQLLNSRGEVLAEIVDYTEREVEGKGAYLQGIDPRQWLYQVVWQARTGNDTGIRETDVPSFQEVVVGQPAAPGVNCLAIANGEGVTEQWKAIMEVDSVSIATKPHELLQSPAEVEVLLEALGNLSHVVYFWDSRREQDDPVGAVRDNCSALLHLVQGLLTQCAEPPSLVLVTENAQAVVEGDPMNGFAQTTLWGLAKVIILEHPELNCTCLDMGPNVGADTVAQEIVALMKAREGGFNGETQLALREMGQCLVSRLVRLERDLGPAPVFHSEAWYLITGGRGGLGMRVAQWLASHGVRHLVLVGRSQPTREVVQELDKLRSAGVEVVDKVADVSDEGELSEILAELQSPLRGVIHAAGCLDDAGLLQQTPESFDSVLLPKVAGAWSLHRLTLRQPLDFFVMFSSATSLLGTPGQANYAAANAFLDGLAEYRRHLGLPGLAINWGGWDEVGMAARTMTPNHFRQQGEDVIPVEQGLEILGALLSFAEAGVGVVPIDWSNFLDSSQNHSPFYERLRQSKSGLQGGGDGLGSEEADSLQQELAEAEVRDRQKILESLLRAEVAQLVGLDLASIPAEEGVGFASLGLDSLTSIQLRNTLQTRLKCSLPVTFAFDYPTAEAAARALVKIVFGGDGEQRVDRDSPVGLQAQESDAKGTKAAEQTLPSGEGVGGAIDPEKPAPDSKAPDDQSLSSMLDELSKHLD